MNLTYWAMIILGAFVAVWMLFVVPAERRHHERKLEILQKRIQKRQTWNNEYNNDSADESNDKQES